MRYFVKFDCSFGRYTVHDKLFGGHIIGAHGSVISACDHANAQEVLRRRWSEQRDNGAR